MKVKSLSRVRLCVTPRTDYTLPGSSIHGIFQARILSGLPFWLAKISMYLSKSPFDDLRSASLARLTGRRPIFFFFYQNAF